MLYGYYGMGNVGDEAILSTLIDRIRESEDDTRIVVASLDPQHTRDNHPVDSVVPRPSVGSLSFNWVREMSKADEIWIGGGGLFSNVDLSLHAVVIWISNAFGANIRVVCAGAAEVSDAYSQSMILKNMLNLSDSVSIRDPLSIQNIRDAGYTGPLQQIPDPVFSSVIESDCSSESNSKIIVSVRKPNNRILDLNRLADSLDELSESHDGEVLFLPFDTTTKPSDKEISREVAKKMTTDSTIYRGEVTHKVASSFIQSADLVVGMRLHSVILAASHCTPVVGIAYENKCSIHLQMLGVESVIWCDNISPSSIVSQSSGTGSLSPDRISEIKAASSMFPSYVYEKSKNRSLVASLSLLIWVSYAMIIRIFYTDE